MTKGSTLKQLQGAIAAGDLIKAAKLSKKLEKESAPVPASKKSSKLILPDDTGEQGGQTIEPPSATDPNASWIAPVFANPGRRTKTDKDGKVMVEARRETVRGGGFNSANFKDDGKGHSNGDAAKIDKANGRKAAHIDRPPPVKKYDISCEGCRRPFQVYQSELIPMINENESTDYIYKCNRCIRRGK